MTAGTLHVTGQGSVSGVPDQVSARLTVSCLRPSIAEAIAAADSVVTAVRAALAELGVAAADATTSGLSAQPEQVWEDGKVPRIVGYRAMHELSVLVREVALVGRVLASALAAGGDELLLTGIHPSVADTSGLRAAARELAWADALASAQQLAGLAGRGLGEVVEVRDSPGQLPMPLAMPMAARMAAGAGFDVQPGAVVVEVTLSVTWSLD